jgi:hypothetical protein
MQEHYELQVLEEQQQREGQNKKDTLKIVQRRNTQSEENSPGWITRGMSYATHKRHKYPAIQETLDKWVNYDISMEYEKHFNKNILPAMLPTTKDAWQCYRSKYLTST